MKLWPETLRSYELQTTAHTQVQQYVEIRSFRIKFSLICWLCAHFRRISSPLPFHLSRPGNLIAFAVRTSAILQNVSIYLIEVSSSSTVVAVFFPLCSHSAGSYVACISAALLNENFYNNIFASISSAKEVELRLYKFIRHIRLWSHTRCSRNLFRPHDNQLHYGFHCAVISQLCNTVETMNECQDECLSSCSAQLAVHFFVWVCTTEICCGMIPIVDSTTLLLATNYRI